MNEPKPPPPTPEERFKKILGMVRQNASAQASEEYRENYLRSCESHGGDIGEAVKVIRGETPVTLTMTLVESSKI